MRFVPGRLVKFVLYTLAGAGVVGLGAAYLLRDRLRPDHEAARPAAEAQPAPGELVAGAANTVRLHPEAVERFGLKTTDVRKAAPPQPLVLPGTLLLDTNHFVRVRSRFAGDIVEVCTPDGTESLDQP